jgi:hypothetical protein
MLGEGRLAGGDGAVQHPARRGFEQQIGRRVLPRLRQLLGVMLWVEVPVDVHAPVEDADDHDRAVGREAVEDKMRAEAS